MNKKNLCIATISWVRNDEEANLLRQSLESLAALEVPVFITDGGSPESFLSFLQSVPQFNVFSAKGLWNQAKKSITEAAKTGAKFIFYTEPDKHEFFSTHLPELINNVEVNEHTGVVMASRSATAFSTFPPFQQMTESTINSCCKEIIGMEADYCYGPFFFNPQLLPYLNALPENCGWEWRPFVFAMAHHLGYLVDAMEGDFFCPQNQRTDDVAERIYRMKQLTQNIEGLLLAASTRLF